MMGIETIRAINAEMAEKARRERIEPSYMRRHEDLFKPPPATSWQEGMRHRKMRGIPHIGDAAADYDKLHERLDTLFVDTSGFGREGELALTQRQMFARLDELAEKHGPLLVALEEQGQFQGYVAVWKAQRKRVNLAPPVPGAMRVTGWAWEGGAACVECEPPGKPDGERRAGLGAREVYRLYGQTFTVAPGTIRPKLLDARCQFCGSDL